MIVEGYLAEPDLHNATDRTKPQGRYLGSKEGGTGTQPRQLIPQAGDRFFLCSDGVTDGIDNDHLKSVLKANDDPQIAADAAVAAALEGGSKDNISCVVINVS